MRTRFVVIINFGLARSLPRGDVSRPIGTQRMLKDVEAVVPAAGKAAKAVGKGAEHDGQGNSEQHDAFHDRSEQDDWRKSTRSAGGRKTSSRKPTKR